MFDDPFYKIDQGEIFSKSQCMWHERSYMDFFRSTLVSLGYTPEDHFRRRWKRNDRTVIVCLADDFNVCGADLACKPGAWFDSKTTVITDNHIVVPTEYEVCQLPKSYFGIFFYQPDLQLYEPEKRFNFSVNRLDTQRLLILLELILQSESVESLLNKDYINFNCWSAIHSNSSEGEIKNNFLSCWNQISQQLPGIYHKQVTQIIDFLPIRNHSLSIEQANLKSWLTPVVETYSGNVTMAFSEKIFRALQTPVPWTLYGTTGAIKFLKNLGFDTLDDVVDHNYNEITQDSFPSAKKINAFVTATMQNYQKLQTMNLTKLQARCQQAALHNQQHLNQYQKSWPKDFSNWWAKTVEKLV